MSPEMVHSSHGREDCSMQWVCRRPRRNIRQTSWKIAGLVANFFMRILADICSNAYFNGFGLLGHLLLYFHCYWKLTLRVEYYLGQITKTTTWDKPKTTGA